MAEPRPQAAGRSPLIFIFLTVFIDLLGFGIVIPLLPIYSKAYGASEAQLGLLFGCFSGMQFLFAPMWGRVSDRIGRKKVLVGGLLGTAAAYLIFGFSDQVALVVSRAWPGEAPPIESLTLGVLFASRLLGGFFGANVSTASAFIADVTTPENRAKGMGLIGAAFGLGFTIGPAVGGELSQVSIELPGIVAAALSLSAAIFGWVKLHEVARAPGKNSRVYSLDQVRGAWADPRIGWALSMGFLAVLAFSAFEAMFILFGLAKFPTYFGMERAIAHATRDDMFAAARYAGRYLFVVGMISAVIQGGLIRRLVPRYGETRLAVAGPVLLGLGLMIVGFAPTFVWVIVGCVVLPFGFGLNNPSVSSLVSRASPADQQGAYLGLQQSLASLARMLGPPLAGVAFVRFGPSAPFFSAAGGLLIATSIAWAYHRRYGASFARAAS
ncbi:MAG: MFS transporter [Planctomycetes bacterium]|nr:MFS transporter [Planctomycetota bacterium]